MNHSSIPLVYPDNCEYDPVTNKLRVVNKQRTKLIVNPAALTFISSFGNKKIGVITVAGILRSGKSYVLSRLLGTKNGFSLGHTLDPETLGIWIGLTVIEKNNTVYFLLDTEGLGAVNANKENDTALFVLANMLSSLLIFNSKNVPVESDLRSLHYITQLIRSIKLQENKQIKPEDLKKLMPHFFWLLRDVCLTPTNSSGQPCSFKEYMLEKVLINSGEFEPTDEDKVRKAILSFYPSFDAFSLPPPSEKPEVVQNMDKVNENEISPQFLEQAETLLQILNNKLPTKKAPDSFDDLNASSYSILVQNYVTMINDPSSIPTVMDAWKSVVLTQVQTVKETALRKYLEFSDTLRPLFPLNEDEIIGKHNEAQMNIISFVKESLLHLSLSDKELSDIYEEISSNFAVYTAEVAKTSVTGGLLKDLMNENYQISLAFCLKLIEDIWKPVSAEIDSNQNYSFDQFLKDLERIEIEYLNKRRGPASNKVFEDWVAQRDSDKKRIELMNGYNKKLLKKKEKEAELRAQNLKLEEDKKTIAEAMKANLEEEKRKQELLQEKHDEDLKKMNEEFHQRMIDNDTKTRELMAAQFDEEKKRNEILNNEFRKNQEALIAQMQQSNESTMQAITALAESIKNMPPPVVTVQGGGCFSGSGLVMKEGEDKMVELSSLQYGDKVASIDENGKLSYSEVYYTDFEDKITEQMLSILCSSHQIKLTGEHILFVSDRSSIDSEKLESLNFTELEATGSVYSIPSLSVIPRHHFLWLWDSIENKMKAELVLKVERKVEKGLYTVLVKNHRLLVNSLLASSYIINHQYGIADTIVMRFLYNYISPSFVNSNLNKYICQVYDNIFEPTALYFRSFFSTIQL